MERRLSAILAADVVGYSRLMGANEVATLTALRDIRHGVVEGAIAGQGGRIVKLMGDGILVEFASVVGALQCALDIQQAMTRRNAGISEDRQILFRMGVNLGDVVVEDGDIFGDGVNIASRLEALASPGGITVSGAVRDQVGNRLEVEFDDGGEPDLKNISKPVRVYHIRSRAADTRQSAAPDLASRPSIAVLPFANMSGDPEQEYFADGIAEDLITDLSKLSGLFVVGRNSAFVYKGKAVNLQDAARELGVRHILEGSVRRAGQRVRVTAQLIDGVTGGHLWADRYDRDLDDIFALQDDITRTIIQQLQVRLLDTETTDHAPTRSAQAYNCYLKGRQHYHMRNLENMQAARASFLQALQHDPDYARAYVGLADCEARMNDWHGADFRVEDILAMTRRALELEPDLAEAHAATGLAMQMAGRDDEALAAYQRALALDPLCYEAHHNFGRYHLVSQNHADAIYHFIRATEILPDDYRSPLLMLVSLERTGRHDDRDRYLELGLRRAEEAARRTPDNPDPLELGASVLAACGQKDRARDWLNRALQADPDGTRTNGYNVACTYALIGEAEEALNVLEQIAKNLGRVQREWMRTDSDFDSIRDHPRFVRMFRGPDT